MPLEASPWPIIRPIAGFDLIQILVRRAWFQLSVSHSQGAGGGRVIGLLRQGDKEDRLDIFRLREGSVDA